MLRLLLVDDHTLVLDSLGRLLDAEPDMSVVGKAGNGHEAVRMCRELTPDLVILDYSLPDIDGLETTRQIVALGLPTRVLILTMHANEEYATRLLRAGASGFIIKAADASELLQAIRKVAHKGTYVSPSVMEKMVVRVGQPAKDAPEAALSDRELQVLLRLAAGNTTREVATSLSLSISTIETYRSRILEKLNLRNNSDLTRFAVRRGLIELD